MPTIPFLRSRRARSGAGSRPWRWLAVGVCIVLGGAPIGAGAGPGAFETGSFHSAALDEDRTYLVHLPDGYAASDRSYPILYFLHGLNNDEHEWQVRDIQAEVDALRAAGSIGDFIIAIPHGGRASFYTNAVNGGPRVEDFVVQDFLPHIEQTYRITPGRRFRHISGVSMGGYGALKLAFKYPDRFQAVSSHAAFLLPRPLNEIPVEVMREWQRRTVGRVFGDPIDPAHWLANDPFALSSDPPRLEGLAIYFDCGTADRYGFDQGNQRLHEVLLERGIPHEFHLMDGGRSHWDQVKRNARASLQFHWRHFQAP